MRMRPAGCSTSNNESIVAPSLVTVTSFFHQPLLLFLKGSTPMSSTSILSRPTGPSDDFTTFAMDCVASTRINDGPREREYRSDL